MNLIGHTELSNLYNNFKEDPKKLLLILYLFYLKVLYKKGSSLANLNWTELDYIVAKYPEEKFLYWLSNKKVKINYNKIEYLIKINILTEYNNHIANINIHRLNTSLHHFPKFFTHEPIFETNYFIKFINNKILAEKLECLLEK